MFELAGRPVSYFRSGECLAENVKAKLGRTLFRTDDLSGGTGIRYELRDFVLRASDLAAAGVPERGDEIVFEGRRYVVAAPEGEPCWKWHTRQSHKQIRVHAKYAGGLEG